MTKRSNLLTVFATVYNVAEYLPRFFQCMESQTYTEYDLLIIDDGSEDNTLEICRSYAQKDPRIDVVHLEHIGIAAARNYAISMIRTPFTASVDGDDVYEPDYLKHLFNAWEKYDADLVISRVSYRNEAYKKTGEIKARGELFIPREQFAEMLPVLLDERRLNFLYAKLFRTEILKKTHVEEDVKHGSDTMFCCQYVTMASSIVLIDDLDTNYIQYSSRSVTSNHDEGEFLRLCRIQHTITEIFRNSGFLTEGMQRAIDKRELQSALWGLSSIAKKDISTNEALNRVHDIFHSGMYTEAYYRQKDNLNTFGFSAVNPEYVILPDSKISGRIIVSMTSYPARIHDVAKVLETIYAQTKKADEVVLWLAEDQFPQREIPERLREFVNEGKLDVQWCEDLMPHKKYFYAFSEFPNDLIITVDDDILYSPSMIEDLYRSYLVHPKAISALRAHLMLLEHGRFLPYLEWIREYCLNIGEESMMLFATTGAGTLFPVYLFNSELLDADAIRQTCLYADEIWLKLMQIEADIPVAVAKQYQGFNSLPGASENSLFRLVNREHHDEQWRAAIAWYDEKYGKGFILKKLEGYKDKFNSIASVNEFYKEKINRNNKEIRKKNEEIRKKNEEITKKNEEIKRITIEIDNKNKEINKKDEEIIRKTIEIDNKNKEITKNKEEIRKRDSMIEKKEYETAMLRKELSRVWGSRSLKVGRMVTWPGRVIKDILKNCPF